MVWMTRGICGVHRQESTWYAFCLAYMWLALQNMWASLPVYKHCIILSGEDFLLWPLKILFNAPTYCWLHKATRYTVKTACFFVAVCIAWFSYFTLNRGSIKSSLYKGKRVQTNVLKYTIKADIFNNACTNYLSQHKITQHVTSWHTQFTKLTNEEGCLTSFSIFIYGHNFTDENDWNNHPFQR